MGWKSMKAKWLARLQRKRDAQEAKVQKAALETYGGTQTCPWCKQCAQSRGDWKFEQSTEDPQLEELTCGTCGGTSLWLWTIMMIYIRPGKPPIPRVPSRSHPPQGARP